MKNLVMAIVLVILSGSHSILAGEKLYTTGISVRTNVISDVWVEQYKSPQKHIHTFKWELPADFKRVVSVRATHEDQERRLKVQLICGEITPVDICFKTPPKPQPKPEPIDINIDVQSDGHLTVDPLKMETEPLDIIVHHEHAVPRDNCEYFWWILAGGIGLLLLFFLGTSILWLLFLWAMLRASQRLSEAIAWRCDCPHPARPPKGKGKLFGC